MVKVKIDKRIERITNLKSDLNFVTDGRNKNKIEKEIEENERKVRDLREKASQLGVYRDTDLQLFSEMVEMETKYKFFRQKVK